MAKTGTPTTGIDGDRTPDGTLVGTFAKGVFTVYVFCLTIATVYLMICLLAATGDKGGSALHTVTFFLFGTTSSFPTDAWLLLICAASGALGACVHVAASFAKHTADQKLTGSWLLWLIMRTPIGVALALIFYVSLRGGLLSATDANAAVSPYGLSAVSALVGLFTHQATQKLKEIFNTLFKTSDEQAAPAQAGAGGDTHARTATAGARAPLPSPGAAPAGGPAPVPALQRLNPAQISQGQGNLGIAAEGAGFTGQSVVRVDGEDRPTTFVSDQRLTFVLGEADRGRPGQVLSITVFTPAPGGGESSPAGMPVTA